MGVMQCLSLCGDYSGRSEVYAVYIGGYGNILGGWYIGVHGNTLGRGYIGGHGTNVFA